MRSHGMSQSHNLGCGHAMRGIVWATEAVDRRSWSLLRGRFLARRPNIGKRPVEAARAVDAKNAPTARWKTGRPVSHSYHRLSLLFSGNRKFVTHVPG